MLILIDPERLITHGRPRKEKVNQYVIDMDNGAKFPPIKAYRRYFGDKWTVTDGAHRTEACRILGRKVLVETTSRIYYLDLINDDLQYHRS